MGEFFRNLPEHFRMILGDNLAGFLVLVTLVTISNVSFFLKYKDFFLGSDLNEIKMKFLFKKKIKV